MNQSTYNTENSQNGQYSQSGGDRASQGNNSYNYNNQPKTQYPRRKSTGTIVVGIVLILIGTSHIVDTFLPWVFDWVDSGLVFAAVAIIAGFALLVKR